MDCLCQTKLLLPCSAESSLWKQASSGETCPAWKHHLLYALPEWMGSPLGLWSVQLTPLQPCPCAGRHFSVPNSPLCMHRAGTCTKQPGSEAQCWRQHMDLSTSEANRMLLPAAGEGAV